MCLVANDQREGLAQIFRVIYLRAARLGDKDAPGIRSTMFDNFFLDRRPREIRPTGNFIIGIIFPSSSSHFIESFSLCLILSNPFRSL